MELKRTRNGRLKPQNNPMRIKTALINRAVLPKKVTMYAK